MSVLNEQELERKGRGNILRLFAIAVCLIMGYSTGAWDKWLGVMLIVLLLANWLEDKILGAFDVLQPRYTEDDNILSSDEIEENEIDSGVSASDSIAKPHTGFDTAHTTQPTQAIDTDVRDIIRFEKGVECVVDMYDAGMFESLTKAIEITFRCSRQPESRAESTYQRALRACKARSQRWQQEQTHPTKPTGKPTIAGVVQDGEQRNRFHFVREDANGRQFVAQGNDYVPLDEFTQMS